MERGGPSRATDRVGTAGCGRAAGAVVRPGVSGRVLGTMLLPLLLLGIVSVSVTAERHRDVVAAEGVTAQMDRLETLLALRSAMFAERLAEEISLTGRRPPDDLLGPSEFASRRCSIAPSSVLDATDAALAVVPAGSRPFSPPSWRRSAADRPRRGRLHRADRPAVGTRCRTRLNVEMEQSLAQVRGAAVRAR